MQLTWEVQVLGNRPYFVKTKVSFSLDICGAREYQNVAAIYIRRAVSLHISKYPFGPQSIELQW